MPPQSCERISRMTPCGQVVFDVAEAEDVLADQAGIAEIAAADEELDIVDGQAGEREVLDLGDRGLGLAADAAQPEIVRARRRV